MNNLNKKPKHCGPYNSAVISFGIFKNDLKAPPNIIPLDKALLF